MRFGRVWSIDPKNGPKCGNQDSVVFRIDLNDGTVEAFVLGNTGGSYQAEEEETEEYGEKSRTHV